MPSLPSLLIWLTGFCTVLYVAKLLLLLLAGAGAGDDGGDGDGDLDVPSGEESGSGFKLLTTQTILAFGMGIGWLSLAPVGQLGMSYPWAMGFGAVNRVFLMWLTIRVLASLRRLNLPPRAVRPGPGDLGRAYHVERKARCFSAGI